MVRLMPHELLILPHSRMKRSCAFVKLELCVAAISKIMNFQKVREFMIIADGLSVILAIMRTKTLLD